MFVSEHYADAHNHAHQKTNHETKSGGVTHRALREIEDSRRLILVHDTILNGGASRCNYSSFSVFSR